MCVYLCLSTCVSVYTCVCVFAFVCDPVCVCVICCLSDVMWTVVKHI